MNQVQIYDMVNTNAFIEQALHVHTRLSDKIKNIYSIHTSHLVSLLAPPSRSTRTHSAWPFSAANINAVWPNCAWLIIAVKCCSRDIKNAVKGKRLQSPTSLEIISKARTRTQQHTRTHERHKDTQTKQRIKTNCALEHCIRGRPLHPAARESALNVRSERQAITAFMKSIVPHIGSKSSKSTSSYEVK